MLRIDFTYVRLAPDINNPLHEGFLENFMSLSKQYDEKTQTYTIYYAPFSRQIWDMDDEGKKLVLDGLKKLDTGVMDGLHIAYENGGLVTMNEKHTSGYAEYQDPLHEYKTNQLDFVRLMNCAYFAGRMVGVMMNMQMLGNFDTQTPLSKEVASTMIFN
jgi:hypothetical protein